MWPLKSTTREQNFDGDALESQFLDVQVILRTFWPWGGYEGPISAQNFEAVEGPFWDHFGSICVPERKFVACDHSQRERLQEQNSDGGDFGSHSEAVAVIWASSASFWANLWSWTQNFADHPQQIFIFLKSRIFVQTNYSFFFKIQNIHSKNIHFYKMK